MKERLVTCNEEDTDVYRYRHFMLINSSDCSTCLFSWYGLLIMVGGVFSETRVGVFSVAHTDI